MSIELNAINELKNERIKQYAKATIIATNGLDCFDYVANIDRFRNRESGCLLKEKPLLNLFGRSIPEKMSKSQVLYSESMGIRQYTALNFIPGEEENIITNGQLELNTWKRPSITPIEGGNAELFLELVNLIFDGNAIAIDFFLDSIASLIQKPKDKWAFMILIIGGQGIGKSILCDIVAQLVGKSNVGFPTVESLKSQFTGWLLNSHVVIFHELEKITRDLATRIKHWITSETLLINTKNIPEFYITNYCNIIACSNHDDIAYLDDDDRRMFIWTSNAKKQPPEYYRLLCHWFFNAEGKSIVFNLLLQRDIKGFNPNAAPPSTNGKVRLIENSRSDIELYLQDALERFRPPLSNDLLVMADVIEFLRAQKVRCSDAEVRGFIRKKAVSLGQVRLKKERPSLWAIRNQDRWIVASHEELIAAYEQSNQKSASAASAVMPVRRIVTK